MSKRDKSRGKRSPNAGPRKTGTAKGEGSSKRSSRGRGRSSRFNRGPSGDAHDDKTYEGTLKLTRDGHGRITLSERVEVRLHRDSVLGARSGDQVKYALTAPARDGRAQGRVLEIVKRASERVVGMMIHEQGRWFIDPEPAGRWFEVGERKGAKPGDAVVARLTQDAGQEGLAKADVIEVIGRLDEHRVQRELAIRSKGWPVEFGEDTIAQAEAFPPVDPEQILADEPMRRDLRSIPLVTIDGEDARDFDDAVAAKREGENIRCWVGIADVAHYVKPKTPLDRDAVERATSVYFPGRVLPMLPESISNGLCSLRPNEPRLAMVVEFVVDKRGERSSPVCYSALIESRARLTYRQVQNAFDTQKAIAEWDSLLIMQDAAQRILSRRQRRGSIELTVPESEVIIAENGEVEELRMRESMFAHRLIEALMVAANESVAELSERHGIKTVFREHAPPPTKKREQLQAFLKPHGIDVDFEALDSPAGMSVLFKRLEQTSLGDSASMLMLRSMAQAKYVVGHAKHYGLASDGYLHFTSPIRRYPDLLVHRAMKALAQKSSSSTPAALAEHCSRREREASEFERDLKALSACQFAEQYIGEVLGGKISGVHRAGLFIQCNTPFFEGFIPIEVLSEQMGDYFEVWEDVGRVVGRRLGGVMAMGDPIEVRVADVSVRERRIRFEVADAGPASSRPRTYRNRGNMGAGSAEGRGRPPNRTGGRGPKSKSSGHKNGRSGTSKSKNQRHQGSKPQKGGSPRPTKKKGARSPVRK